MHPCRHGQHPYQPFRENVERQVLEIHSQVDHRKNPLKWTSVVESVWHDLQGGINRFDPEALAGLELVLDVYNSDDHQWSQWTINSYEQHSDRVFTVGEVLQSIIDRHGLHFTVSVTHSSPSSSGKHLRDLTPSVNMIEDFVTKACASCGKQFTPKVPQYKKCDGCFSRRDKKTKLSSVDTTVTMTPAVQESFNQRRKFKTMKQNAKRWSKNGGASSSSGPSPVKKAKSDTVNIITSQGDVDDADQSEFDELAEDLASTGFSELQSEP